MKKRYQILKLSHMKFKGQIFWTNLRYFFYNFQRKNLKIFRYFDQRKIGSIPRILVSSLVLISFFYATPIMINFGNENFFYKNEFWMLIFSLGVLYWLFNPSVLMALVMIIPLLLAVSSRK